MASRPCALYSRPLAAEIENTVALPNANVLLREDRTPRTFKWWPT